MREFTPHLVREAGGEAGEQHYGLADSLSLAWERVRLRGYRRVLWQRHLWEQTAQSPAQGLAIPHEEIEIVCLDLDDPSKQTHFYETDPAARRLTERLARLEAAWAQTGYGALGELAALFGLEPVEIDFLLLCAAPEFDPRLRRLYGYVHDDAALCAPTQWLARVLFQWEPTVRLTPNCTLVRWLLAYPGPGEEQPWSLSARWTVDPRITGYLCGQADLAPSLEPAGRWLEAENDLAYEPAGAPSLGRFLEDAMLRSSPRTPRLAQLLGAEGVGRKTWAARLGAELGLPLLCLDAPRLFLTGSGGSRLVEADLRERLVRAEREALLQGCLLYWDRADQVPPDVWGEALFTAPVQLFGVEHPIRFPVQAPLAEVIAFPLPTPVQAQALWQRVLPREGGDFGARALAELFTLTPAEITGVAAGAGEDRDSVWKACRSLSLGRLGKLATLLPCPFTWADIVLPADTSAHLREIAAQAAHRITVYDDWGFGDKRPLGRGVSALFAGPSGTGKTMAAQVLAAEMGVALFRIDLAGVVSKYVGETEKNLRRIFDEAERLNAVLFFDEADALFGKRTEVKDAHDRYANIEINYLLQRMESYDGLAILATNRKGDIDPAFLRRLRFIVDFPMPGLRERAAIWRLALPEHAPDGRALLARIDWDWLATRLEITGAAIKDIALGAAFLACEAGTKIGMQQLGAAARRELMKHGKLVGVGDFGE